MIFLLCLLRLLLPLLLLLLFFVSSSLLRPLHLQLYLHHADLILVVVHPFFLLHLSCYSYFPLYFYDLSLLLIIIIIRLLLSL